MSEQLGDMIERLTAELHQAMREQKDYFERLSPPCPVDGQGGTFVGCVGSIQMVVMAYECPNGHRFSYRDELEELAPDVPVSERSRLLNDQSGGTIRPKKDLWPDAE